MARIDFFNLTKSNPTQVLPTGEAAHSVSPESRPVDLFPRRHFNNDQQEFIFISPVRKFIDRATVEQMEDSSLQERSYEAVAQLLAYLNNESPSS